MDVRFDSDSKMIKKDAEALEFRNEMSLLMEKLVINRHASESEMTHSMCNWSFRCCYCYIWMLCFAGWSDTRNILSLIFFSITVLKMQINVYITYIYIFY